MDFYNNVMLFWHFNFTSYDNLTHKSRKSIRVCTISCSFQGRDPVILFVEMVEFVSLDANLVGLG